MPRAQILWRLKPSEQRTEQDREWQPHVQDVDEDDAEEACREWTRRQSFFEYRHTKREAKRNE